MSYLVLVVLSLLWLGFFLPGLLQARRSSSPLASASTFQESLTRISTGRAVSPEDVAAAARRSRNSRLQVARQLEILAVLSAAFLASLVLAVAFGGVVRWATVPTGIALLGYVAALRLRAVHVAPRRRGQPPRPRGPVHVADEQIVPSVGRRPSGGQRPELERIAG